MKLKFDDFDKYEEYAKEALAKKKNMNWFPDKDTAVKKVLDINTANLKFLLMALNADSNELNDEQKKTQDYIRDCLYDESVIKLVDYTPRKEPLKIKREELDTALSTINNMPYQIGADLDEWYPSIEDIKSREANFDKKWVYFLYWVINSSKELDEKELEVKEYIEDFLNDEDNIVIVN